MQLCRASCVGQGLSTLGLALDCCGRSVGPWGQMRWPPAPLAEQHGQDQALGGIGSGHVLLISFKGRQVMGGQVRQGRRGFCWVHMQGGSRARLCGASQEPIPWAPPVLP